MKYKSQTDNKSYDHQVSVLVKEIKERIHKLNQCGVKKEQLQALIEGQPQLSRLLITEDFRILLPDYNNVEIKLTPLAKSVYFLFLTHSEGILFKDLSDHREELLHIYKLLTQREKDENIHRSVNDLVNPFSNSINEKCARIRGAFLGKLDFRHAKSYIIAGKRGEAKKIALPRHLVVWNSKLRPQGL